MFEANWPKPPAKVDITRFKISSAGNVIANTNQYYKNKLLNAMSYDLTEGEQRHILSQLNGQQNRQLIYVKPDSGIGKKLVMSGKDKLIMGNEEYRLTDSIKEESDVDKLVSSVKNKEKNEVKELKEFLAPICSLAVDINKLALTYFKMTNEKFKMDERFYINDNDDQKTAIRISSEYLGYEYNIKFYIIVRTTSYFLWTKKEKREIEKVLELSFVENRVETIYDFNSDIRKNLDTWLPRLGPLVEALSNKLIHYFELIKQSKEKISYRDAYKYEIPNKVEDYRKAIKEILEN